jgi:hypothetical protein
VQSEIGSVEFDRPGAVGAEWRASNSGINEGTKVSGSDRRHIDLRIKEMSRFSLVSCAILGNRSMLRGHFP